MVKSVESSDASAPSEQTERAAGAEKKRKKPFLTPWVATIGIVLATMLVIVYGGFREEAEPVAPVPKLTNVEVQTIKTRPYI